MQAELTASKPLASSRIVHVGPETIATFGTLRPISE